MGKETLEEATMRYLAEENNNLVESTRETEITITKPISTYIEITDDREEWDYPIEDMDEARANNDYLVIDTTEPRVYEVTEDEFNLIKSKLEENVSMKVEAKTLTWNEIMDNAEGTTFGQKALKVKDTARDNVEQLMQKDGVNIEELESVEDAIEEYTNKNNIKFDESGNVLNESKLVERKQSVTEYIISFMDGELHDEYDGEFITEDKAEADALFDELKAQHKLNQVDQYIAKTWVWNMSDYDEDTVEVYFNNGDEQYMYEESKLIESNDVDLPESFYEKVCRAYVDTMNLEWVAEDKMNGTVVHGYFEDDDYANKFKDKVNNDNFKDIYYGQYTDDYIEAEEPEYYSYQSWEDFYYSYVEDNIKYDVYDIGIEDFYISLEDLDKLGIDYSEALDVLNDNKVDESKSLTETVDTNEDVIIKTMQDKDFLKILDVSPLEIIDQVKLSKAQFDELDKMIKTSGKSFAELYDELGGWNLDNPDKYYDVDNYFDCYYKSLLVTVKVKDGNLMLSPKDVYVYPSDISGEPVDELFHLDFDEPIDYTKIENQYNKSKQTESKYPKKIKTHDGYVLTKVNDGLPENANIPEYMNDNGDVTLVSDVDKYEVIEEAKSNEYALNVKNKTTDEFMYQVDCYPTYEVAKAEADKLNLNDNETYYIVAIDYGEDGNEIGISKIEESGNDKAIWEKVEKIVDEADNDLYPDSNNDYEYDAHIVFNIYRDAEFEDIFVVTTYLDGEIQDELDTGDVHLEDLDRTLVDIVKKLHNKQVQTESKSLNNNDFKNLLDNGNVVKVGGKQNYTPTDFYVDTNKIVWYKNSEISFGWEKHPSMNYEDLLNHLAKMQKDGFTVEVVDTKPPVIKESKELKTESILKNIQLEDKIDDWVVYSADIDKELGKDIIDTFSQYEDDEGNVITNVRIDYNTTDGSYIVNYVDNNGRFHQIDYELSNAELSQLNQGDIDDIEPDNFRPVYVDQKEKLSDGSYHMRLVCDGYKMWVNVGQYKGNGVVQWDYDFDSPEYDVDAEDYINSSVDVNDIEEAILKAILTKKTEGDNPDVEKHVMEYLESNQLYPSDVFTADDRVMVDISWGDWKHDHIRCDKLMENLGYTLVEEEVTEEDGSDCYSAIRHYIPKGSITNLDESNSNEEHTIWDSEISIEDYDVYDAEELYDEYVNDMNAKGQQPEKYDEWVSNVDMTDDISMWKLDDLENNILPEISKQLNDDILLLSGNYNSNYADFRPSGAGGVMWNNGVEGYRDYVSNFDRLRIISHNGIIGSICGDHDGTVSGDFYTLPDDMTALTKALSEDFGFVKEAEDMYDAEENKDSLNKDEYIYDYCEGRISEEFRYGGIDANDLNAHLDLLKPIKDTISKYGQLTENKSRNNFIAKWKDYKNFKCSWCGTQFEGSIDSEGRMPNCPHCLEDRYADDENKTEDGHANKDVHFCDSTGEEIYTDFDGTVIKENKGIKTESKYVVEYRLSDTQEIVRSKPYDNFMDAMKYQGEIMKKMKDKIDYCKYINLDENKAIKLEKMTVDRPEFNSEYDKIKQELEDKLLNGATNDDIIEFYKEISDKVTDKEFSALVTFAGEIGLWVVKEFDTVDEMEKYLRDNHIKVMERQSKDGKIVIRYPKISGLQEDRHTVTNGPVTYTGFDDVNNGKIIISDEGTYTYVIYQEDSFTQVISHIKKIDDTKYAYGSFGDDGYTTSKESAIDEIINSIMKEYNLNNKPEIVTENKSMKTEAPEKDGETYNKLCDEIQFQAEENNIDITEEQVKKVADKICYEDRYFFSNSLPEDEEDWSEVNTYILQSIKTVLGLQEDYKSLDNQLDKLIAKDATDKEFNDFIEKASNDDTITNNEYTELVKKAQDTRRINEGKSIKVESKLSDEIADLDTQIKILDLDIKKKVKQYTASQKRYHGDNAESDRLEAEIDSLELEQKKLQNKLDELTNNIQNDPEYREYVVSLLKDGAIDDPEYVNGLSTEEFDDLVTNTWMKDIDVINSYMDAKNLNEGKSIKVESKYDTMAFAQLLPMSFTDMVDNDVYDRASEIFDDGGTNEDVVDYYIDMFKGYIADDEEALDEFDEDLAKKYVEYKLDNVKNDADGFIPTIVKPEVADVDNWDDEKLIAYIKDKAIDEADYFHCDATKIIDKSLKALGLKESKLCENNVDDTNIENIKDVLVKSGISNERTLDLMSKDVLRTLKSNYADDCSADGIYYGVAITDAIQKVIERITGNKPKMKFGEGKSIKFEDTEYISKYDELEELLDLHAGTTIDKQGLYNYFNDDNQMNTDFDDDKYDEWLDDMRENHFDELYEYLTELDDDLESELNDLYEGKSIKCESTNKEVITITDGTNSTELDYNSLDFGIGDYFYNGNETGAQIGFYWNEYKDMTYVNGLYLTVYVGDESNDDLETLDKTLKNLTPNEPYKVTLSDEDYKTFLDWKAMCDKTEFTYWNNLFEDKALDENATDDRFNSTLESWERLGYKLYKQESTITVLINDSKDMPIAIAFNGKASKPIWHYKFSNMDDLDSYVNKSIENAKAREQSKADRKAQRKLTSEHDIKVGDIFYTSWGYDQTNTEFYEVVNVRGSRIDLKEIGYTVDYEKASYGREDITPVPHKFVNDKVYTVSARADGTVTNLEGKDFLNLYKYTGGSHEVTATGWGH